MPLPPYPSGFREDPGLWLSSSSSSSPSSSPSSSAFSYIYFSSSSFFSTHSSPGHIRLLWAEKNTLESVTTGPGCRLWERGGALPFPDKPGASKPHSVPLPPFLPPHSPINVLCLLSSLHCLSRLPFSSFTLPFSFPLFHNKQQPARSHDHRSVDPGSQSCQRRAVRLMG